MLGSRSLHPKVLTLWRLGVVVGVVSVGLVCVVGPIVAVLVDNNVPRWLPVVGFVLTAAIACVAWTYATRRFRSWRVDFTDEALHMHRGSVWLSASAIPYHRIQQIDIEQGPLQRRFGLVSLRLRTASASTDGKVPGLARSDAEALRSALLQRADRDDGA
jgi:membrane protein YdbS with pleckstrin-like domain